MGDPTRDEPGLTTRLGAELLGAVMLTFVAAGGDAMARVSGGEISVAARAVAAVNDEPAASACDAAGSGVIRDEGGAA